MLDLLSALNLDVPDHVPWHHVPLVHSDMKPLASRGTLQWMAIFSTIMVYSNQDTKLFSFGWHLQLTREGTKVYLVFGSHLSSPSSEVELHIFMAGIGTSLIMILASSVSTNKVHHATSIVPFPCPSYLAVYICYSFHECFDAWCKLIGQVSRPIAYSLGRVHCFIFTQHR